MVVFKNGVMRLSQSDFVYCPICGTQVKDGKKHRVKCSIIGVDLLPHSGPFLTAPIAVDLEEGEFKVTSEREKVAWEGCGIRIIFLCEDGHKWERVIANHAEVAISFAEIIADHKEQEAEIDELAQEDDGEDEEDSE